MDTMSKTNELIDRLIDIKDSITSRMDKDTINDVCEILHKIERGELVEAEQISVKIDRCLAFLDGLNKQNAIRYSDYSCLHDLVSTIDGEKSVK